MFLSFPYLYNFFTKKQGEITDYAILSKTFWVSLFIALIFAGFQTFALTLEDSNSLNGALEGCDSFWDCISMITFWFNSIPEAKETQKILKPSNNVFGTKHQFGALYATNGYGAMGILDNIKILVRVFKTMQIANCSKG